MLKDEADGSLLVNVKAYTIINSFTRGVILGLQDVDCEFYITSLDTALIRY